MRVLRALMVFLFAATPSLAQMPGNNGGNMAPLFFNNTVLLIIIGAIIAFVLFVFSRSVNAMHQNAHPPHKTAMDILRERFAKGEINREEFEEKRDVLQG
jgi:putative membrane protein